ncbi:MAG TPA: SHOCT domain-containing protein [Opitutaceae bacterium]|nr:SHOCT domain-containing protein [Opitutaceae bacterium]
MMRSPLVRLSLLAAFVFSAGSALAQSEPKFESLGDNTYTVTVHATHKFTRNTKKLEALATEAAEAFCAREGKVMKLISTDDKRGMYGVGEFAKATLTFRALPPGAAELAPAQSQQTQVRAPLPATPTDSLYDELLKLDDLRKRGILTDGEFEAEKKKVLGRSQ